MQPQHKKILKWFLVVLGILAICFYLFVLRPLQGPYNFEFLKFFQNPFETMPDYYCDPGPCLPNAL